MLAHELAAALAADRERHIRDLARRRGLPSRRTAFDRLRDLAALLRPRTTRPPARSPRRTARAVGGVAGGVSGRAGGAHGQGAC